MLEYKSLNLEGIFKMKLNLLFFFIFILLLLSRPLVIAGGTSSLSCEEAEVSERVRGLALL